MSSLPPSLGLRVASWVGVAQFVLSHVFPKIAPSVGGGMEIAGSKRRELT